MAGIIQFSVVKFVTFKIRPPHTFIKMFLFPLYGKQETSSKTIRNIYSSFSEVKYWTGANPTQMPMSDTMTT